MLKWAHTAMGILFPARCLWCGKVLGFTSEPCCDARAEAWLLPPMPLLRDVQITYHASVTQAWAVYAYQPPISTAILAMKYQNKPVLAKSFANQLVWLLENTALLNWVNLLLPVPMAPVDLYRRGYNQTALMVQCMHKSTGIPFSNKALRKVRTTPKQASLTGAQRRQNVVGCYAVPNKALVQGKNILLIDDVITTGSTVSECAKALLQAGAAEVRCLCIAASLLE